MVEIDIRSKTIILDIDGTLLKHPGTQSETILKKAELLPGVLEKFHEWDSKGYRVILITGRKESTRHITEKQLTELGLFWDHLIMGVGGGDRVLINDRKHGSTEDTAFVINIDRNTGLISVQI